MSIYRVDVIVGDPQPVFDWIDEHVPKVHVVRHVAFETVRGWHMKCVFRRQPDAEAFQRAWCPSDDRPVTPFGDLGTV